MDFLKTINVDSDEDEAFLQQENTRAEFTESKTFLNYISSQFSLTELSTVAVIANLWNQPDVKKCMKEAWEELDHTSESEIRQIVETVVVIVQQNLDSMHLPRLFTKKMSKHISPMGLKLLQFLYELHNQHINVEFYFGQNFSFYFTSGCTVDKVKCVSELLKYEISSETLKKSNSKFDLYQLSCNYCLTEYVTILWSILSVEEQAKLEHAYNNSKNHLVAYWTSFIKNGIVLFYENILFHDTHSLYRQDFNCKQNMISFCVHVGNTVAFKYFWSRTKVDEESIRHWAKTAFLILKLVDKREYYQQAHLLLFLLSQDESLQINFFQNYTKSSIILECLYYVWPLQQFLLPTIQVMLNFITDFSDELLLDFLSMECFDIKQGRRKESMFRIIWCMCPEPTKKIIMQSDEFFHLILLQLLRISDFDMVLSLLNKLSIEKRTHIVSKMFDCVGFFIGFSSNTLNAFDELLSNTLSTSRNVLAFKQNALVKYAEHVYCKEEKPEEEFINWAFKFHYEIQDINDMHVNPVKLYTSLVFFNNYERTQQYLSWYFKTEEDLNMFKESVLQEDNIEIIIELLHFYSSFGQQGWEQFEKFINFNFSSSESISQFKSIYVNHMHSFFNTAAVTESFNFCSQFLEWCFETNNEIIEFKNKLMISLIDKRFYSNLLNYVKNDSLTDWMSIKKDIMWFSPDKKTVDTLKSVLSSITLPLEHCYRCQGNCSKHNRKTMFLRLLDSVFAEDNSLKCENSISSFNLEAILVELSAEN